RYPRVPASAERTQRPLQYPLPHRRRARSGVRLATVPSLLRELGTRAGRRPAVRAVPHRVRLGVLPLESERPQPILGPPAGDPVGHGSTWDLNVWAAAAADGCIELDLVPWLASPQLALELLARGIDGGEEGHSAQAPALAEACVELPAVARVMRLGVIRAAAAGAVEGDARRREHDGVQGERSGADDRWGLRRIDPRFPTGC